MDEIEIRQLSGEINPALDTPSVENIVDYFLQFFEKILDFPLVKSSWILIDDATPYLSTNLLNIFRSSVGLVRAQQQKLFW